ncbi:hypothetical protein J4G07_18250 [Candidatus Poribacteria bacterium]|nr:hypothetical protein [Candidatus Poribacteria bacterium]
MENADANEWRVISELPTQRASFATAVVDGKIYLIGGTLFEHERGIWCDPGPGICRGPFGMSLVEVYDPETNTWERLTDMPTVRSDAKAAVVAGRIYVLAGRVGKDNRHVNLTTLKVVEMYDPETDTWVRKQDMSRRRAAFGIGVVAGKIYAIGGNVDPRDKKPEDPGRVDLVEVYDPATDTWSKCRHDAMALRQRLFGTPFTPSVGLGGRRMVKGVPRLLPLKCIIPKPTAGGRNLTCQI